MDHETKPTHKYPSVHSTGYQTPTSYPVNWNTNYTLDDGFFSDFYGQEDDVTDCPDVVTNNSTDVVGYHPRGFNTDVSTPKRKSLEWMDDSTSAIVKRCRGSASSTICNNLFKACKERDPEAFNQALDSTRTLFILDDQELVASVAYEAIDLPDGDTDTYLDLILSKGDHFCPYFGTDVREAPIFRFIENTSRFAKIVTRFPPTKFLEILSLSGESMLSIAIKLGNQDVVMMLLKLGANPNNQVYFFPSGCCVDFKRKALLPLDIAIKVSF